MYKNFQSLLDSFLERNTPARNAVVAGANDAHALEAVFKAQEMGCINPVLVGNEKEIAALIKEGGYQDRSYTIVGIEEGVNPSQAAVQQIHAGKGNFIIKGKLETKDLLKPVLNKETGLNKKGFITHFGYMQLKGYHKLLAISDCAVIPYPTLEQKAQIIEVCVEALGKLGYEKPIVGALCAVETVNPKMPETLDAQKLQQMSENGQFSNSIVVGPISYDLATSIESAAIKGYSSPAAGNVDMLLVPQLVTGNVMSKIWNADESNVMAGCLIGADIPIVLTSRSASMAEKLNSIILCAVLS